MKDGMIEVSKHQMNKLYADKYATDNENANIREENEKLNKDVLFYKKLSFSLAVIYLLLFVTVVVAYG